MNTLPVFRVFFLNNWVFVSNLLNNIFAFSAHALENFYVQLNFPVCSLLLSVKNVLDVCLKL